MLLFEVEEDEQEEEGEREKEGGEGSGGAWPGWLLVAGVLLGQGGEAMGVRLMGGGAEEGRSPS